MIIEQTIQRWHRVLSGNHDELDALLADDVVFFSPVVFKPQEGKDLTKMYLMAAASTFGPTVEQPSESQAGSDDSSRFHYTKEVLAGNHAVLEFEVTVEGKYINGVDIITCNDAGLITEFRVMLRPLQAVNLLHQKMGEMLKKLAEL
jgi:hypothetical protein